MYVSMYNYIYLSLYMYMYVIMYNYEYLSLQELKRGKYSVGRSHLITYEIYWAHFAGARCTLCRCTLCRCTLCRCTLCID